MTSEHRKQVTVSPVPSPGSYLAPATWTVDWEHNVVKAGTKVVGLPNVTKGYPANPVDNVGIVACFIGGDVYSLTGSSRFLGAFRNSNFPPIPTSYEQASDQTFSGGRRLLFQARYEPFDGSANVNYTLNRAQPWGPGAQPTGTAICSGTIDLRPDGAGTAALVGFEVKLNATRYAVQEQSLPQLGLHFTRQDANALVSTTLKIDLLDDEGNWYEAGTISSSNAALTAAAPQVNMTTWVAFGSGGIEDAAALNPRAVSFRKNSDPLGTARYGTFPFLYLEPVGPVVGREVLVPVQVTVALDAYKPSTEVTGDNPAVQDGDGDIITATPNGNGGIDVKDGNGNIIGTTGPLPGGPANGPITIRIDGDTLLVIYDGMVVWVYKLSQLPWFDLNLSTLYVGLYDPGTSTFTPGTPTYPPLGGWRYRLFAEQESVGISPNLFRRYYRGREGVTVIDYGTHAEFSAGGWPAELVDDPSVTVYPGGFEYLVPAGVATRIAEAGGLEWLTEVQP